MNLSRTFLRNAAVAIVETLCISLLFLLCTVDKAEAQYQTETLRTPLIIGAPSAPAYSIPYEGQAPPIGDGFAPPGVTPGHRGYAPEAVPSHVPGIPEVPAGETGKAMVNGYVAPYLTPPTRFDPNDPGAIDNPPNFYSPPVNQTTINPGGGISGGAPITRWGGQTTQDFGRGGRGGSVVRDFGQKLTEKPDIFRQPQFSQDGPRPTRSGGRNGANRAPSRVNAEVAQDLHGAGALPQARMTIADY